MLRNYLFIDGTNLYAAQFELFGPNQYLYFPEFLLEVEKKLKIRFKKVFFYASYSPRPDKPTEKQKLYLKNEHMFYASVRKCKRALFYKGYRSPTSGLEKGVDMRMGLDILKFGFKNEYECTYLLTGDADFLQVIKDLKELRKESHVVCLETRVMYEARRYTYLDILYTDNKPYIKSEQSGTTSYCRINLPRCFL